jgi:sugar lactone lactonase YvrE
MFLSMKSDTIRTIAGTGEPGYSGEGQLAVTACLCEPKGLAVDGAGGLFIADSENHVVRKLDLATGIITTVAGNSRGPAADPGSTEPAGSHPSSEEDPFMGPSAGPERFLQMTDVSGTVRFTVGKASGARVEGDGGPATAAALNFPSSVAVDGQGNLYIADTLNHCMRRVDAATGLITTVAGTGAQRFSGDGGPGIAATLNEPAAVVIDQDRYLYIADQGNHRVRRLDLVTGLISTVAGTGEAAYNGDGMPAVEAALAGPSGLALGPDHSLYVADTFNGRIRRIDLESGRIDTVAGDGGAYRYQGRDDEVSMSLSRPYGLTVEPDGDLLITDSDSHLIRRWERDTRLVSRVAGNGRPEFGGDEGPPRESYLNFPFGVAVDRQGNIYIADTFNHRIRMIAV